MISRILDWLRLRGARRHARRQPAGFDLFNSVVCECSDLTCSRRVIISAREYERVKALGWVVSPACPEAAGRLVEAHESWHLRVDAEKEIN